MALQKQTAEVLVKVLAVYNSISGVFCFFFSILLPMAMLSIDMGSVISLIVGIFFLAMGVLLMLLGRGLRLWRNWARVMAVALAWAGVGFSTFWIVLVFATVTPVWQVDVSIALLILLSLCYNGFVLWLLQFEPTTKSLFLKAKKR